MNLIMDQFEKIFGNQPQKAEVFRSDSLRMVYLQALVEKCDGDIEEAKRLVKKIMIKRGLK